MAKNVSVFFVAFFLVLSAFKTTLGADGEPECVASKTITQEDYDAGEELLDLFCAYDATDKKEQCYDQFLYAYCKGAGVEFGSLSDMTAALCDEEKFETKVNDQLVDTSCKIGKRVHANGGAFAILDGANCDEIDDEKEACKEEKEE